MKLSGRQQDFAAVTESTVWLMIVIISQKEGTELNSELKDEFEGQIGSLENSFTDGN